MSKKDYYDSDTFCILPWVHMCVRPDEALKPCCRYQAKGDPVGVNLDSLSQNGIKEMDNEYLTKLRQDMLDGIKRTECQKCFIQEENTGILRDRTSTRLFLNERFFPFFKDEYTNKFDKVRYIEMSVDNICNLQCKMCDSKFSSKLQNRDKFLGEEVFKKLEPSFTKFDNIDLSELCYVKILGGEPFITPNFIKFIEYLEHRSNPSNIVIEIASNATALPSESLLNKLNKFKHLFINVSLDAFDKTNDYQRFGSHYLDTFKNAQIYEKIFNSVQVSFHSTISLLTANSLANTLDVLINENKYHVSVDFVRYPPYLSLLNAPEDYIQWVLDKNKHNSTAYKLLNTFVKNSKYNPKIWNEFIEVNNKLDDFYKTSINDYNPELVDFLKEHNYGL